MPTYTFKNTATGEEFEEFMSMSERERFLADNPDVQQTLKTFPGIVDSVRIGVHKTPDSWKDVLKKAKNAHRHSTIDV